MGEFEGSRAVDAWQQTRDGVVRVDQLRSVGVTSALIRRRLRSGAWQRVGSGVLALASGPLSAEQQDRAALALTTPDGALCGLTAAGYHGLKGWDDGRIHVVVPRGRRPGNTPLPVAIHESRRFDPALDLDQARAVPMTRLDRSVLDAATWAPSARRACAIVVASLQQHVTTVEALRSELNRIGLVRYHQLLQVLLNDIAGNEDALRTIDLRRLCRQHGLPAPRHASIREDYDGRQRFLEAELTSRRGKSWLVQIDAAAHLIVGPYWLDDEPPDHLVAAIASLLSIPALDLYLNETEVVTHLHRLIND